MTLISLICEIFGYQKKNFTPVQFQMIILQLDQNLILTEIDKLFSELDCSKNDKVFYEALEQELNSITEEDNPEMRLINKSKILTENNRMPKSVL